MRAPAWTDEKVDRLIGVILQTGVIAAGLVVTFGGIMYLVRYGAVTAGYGVFQPDRGQLHSLGPVIRGALHADGRSIIQLGLLLLIATPVVRVAFSIFAFWVQRDRTYVCITCAVLAILLYSLFGGVH